jgi:hypothetical protein
VGQVPFVVFFVLCGVGALTAALLMGRFLWREDQRWSALLVGSLAAAVGLFCFGCAWVWWDGPLF